ncbi:MAG: hypothetical protein JW902_10605 [Syntrophaceae bacterium]|nr:hypothetical protein [Syntrophaceae bacterium]
MIEQTLDRLAEKILSLDEASLASLWEKYKARMDQFDRTKEWEKAVIIFFIINSVRAKNHIFNEHVMLEEQSGKSASKKTTPSKKPDLRIVK